MNATNCTGEYWQPNSQLGTPWVCDADQNRVKLIFWICIALIIFAGIHVLIPRGLGPQRKLKKNKEGNQENPLSWNKNTR